MKAKKGRMLGIFMSVGGFACLMLGGAIGGSVERNEYVFLQVIAILVGTLATTAGIGTFLTYAFTKAERKYLKKELDL